MGLIGPGGSMIGEFLACENLRVTAICDINDPALHTNSEHDHENLLKQRLEVDLSGCWSGRLPRQQFGAQCRRPERGSCEGMFHKPSTRLHGLRFN